MSPLLSTPLALAPGPEAVAKPSFTAVSSPSLPPSSALSLLAAVNCPEPPDVSTSWIPSPAELTSAVTPTLLAAWAWPLMSLITSCSVAAPSRLTLTELPAASVSFM